MIAWNDVDGDPELCDPLEWGKSSMDELGRHAASVEDIAAMDDEVDFTAPCGLECALEVLEEV